ncbi:MAG: HAMP domain-containing histidine kinase [Desulfobulbaceae bacterium]|nr:HAMP domain-containing histidine kinase [Desulfobulbaceae bacterium]HIJ90207.1 HAMP domain-containing histidine kinase [Deltaproteobacteria bacterium]
MRKFLFPALLLVVVAIGMLHLFTPGDFIYYHNTYRRLSYFPIVLGGLWFGVQGGLVLAVLSTIAFIPHVLLYVGHGPQAYLSELTEIVLYLAAGLVVGVISGRQTRLRERDRLLSEKLRASYVRLQEETAQLIEAETRLAAAQKFSALGRLSASLAHEIKNPLASIKGTAEILRDEFPGDHPKREFVDILLKETDRLHDTVEDILRYSKGQPQERGELLEPLAAVVRHVGALLERQLREKQVSFIFPENGEAQHLLVESVKFSQVFLNLGLNALDAVQPGGHIWFMVESAGEGGWRISVCDDGPGVVEAEKERIFEPFYSRKAEGTGLGLLISRKIVESYGGSLRATDRSGGGACFEILLPAKNGSSLGHTG